MLKNHSLPSKDLFTFTSPPDMRCYDTQWLFQILITVVHHIGSWNALIGLRIIWILFLCISLWLWLKERGISTVYIFISVLFVIANSRYRFGIRPELLTFSFMMLQLRFYDKSVNEHKLYFIPLLIIQFLWTNWHSSSILGLFLGVAFVADQLLSMFIGKLRLEIVNFQFTIKKIPIIQLTIFLISLFIVTLINPNGWMAPLFAITESNYPYILEIMPPASAFFIGASGLTLLLALIGWRKFFEDKSIFLMILCGAFTLQSFRMIRFFPYLAICLAPIQAQGLKIIVAKIQRIKWKFVHTAFYILTSGVIATSVFLNIKSEGKPLFTFGVDDSACPVSAVDFVLREKIRGHFYNEFGTGGYLIYSLFPEQKVFIFGETRINGPLLDRLMNLGGAESWRSLFDEYQITYAIINCAQSPLSTKGIYTIPKIIFSWSDWKLVFWDDIAMVFVKDIPEHKDLIRQYASRVFPESIPFRNNPMTNIPELELLVKDSSQWQFLETELIRAIKESPHHFRAALALGMLRDAQGNPQGAMEAYNLAGRIDSNQPDLLHLLARWYFNQQNYEKATEYIKKAISNGLNKADGLYNLALIQYTIGKKDEALKIINKLLKIRPNHPQALKLHEYLIKR